MTTKQELLEQLEKYQSYDFYKNDARLALIIKLVKETDESDPDFKLALEHETALQVIDLILDCYTEKDLLKWLVDNDFDLFINYRLSDYDYFEDIDPEELEEEKENALFVNEKTKVLVRSWKTLS